MQGWVSALLLCFVVLGGASVSAQSIQTVGPNNTVTDFPLWLEDTNGLALAICDDEGLCAFARPDVLSPLSFPGNFPDESFWYTCDALMPTNGIGTAQMVIAMEAAFANGDVIPGDQIAFGRLRIRADGLQASTTYTITTPYEVIDLDTDGAGEINATFDRGFGGAPFSGLLNAGIGPFLQWDPAFAPAPPAGYIGDINVEHAVIGSPIGANYFRIEGPGAGLLGAANLCADPTLGPDPIDTTDCIETPNFILTGKLATQLGVTVDRATYTKTAAGTVVGVWATSASGQDLSASVAGVTEFALVNEPGTGRYFGRFPISNVQAVPTSVTVTNYSDIPNTVVGAPLTDLVRIIQASFDENTGTLVVRGNTSDSIGAQSLSIGFGAANAGGGSLDATGTLTVSGLSVPPAQITLDSSAGGRTTADVVVTGISAQLLADAGVDVTAAPGATVTLDGSGSTGALSFVWTVASTLPAGTPLTITNANSAVASITLPLTSVQATLELTVSDGLGAQSSDLVVVTNVTGDLPPTANAGVDQTIDGGAPAALEGTAGGLFDSVLWTQLAGPTVVLSDPTALAPTFTMPTGQNVLTFQLTVSGPFGAAVDTVTIDTPLGGIPTVTVISARYRVSRSQWRVTGTASIPGPGHSVTIYLGSDTTGPVIGSTTVDNLGDWDFRERNSPIPSGPQITIVTSLGGQLVGVPVTIN